MIPVATSITQVDELPGEEIEFGIGDVRAVMRANARLYSDITTAIIREYSTNAHDAHIMAGNPDPIEVTLPSVMNPYFTVEDKGVGMDIEDFRIIYTQFGTSNKRESNDTNGTLGFGSKSGVAYTTQFTVMSVKDGTKIHAVIMRRPDWSITMKVVSTSLTDEKNGTKITIPVHNIDEFVAKARDFYKFWLPGRVKVNGQEPEHNVGEKIVDNLYYSRQWNTSYVVMGNVPYRINNPSALFYNSKMSAFNFVAYVNNADVEFTPSREDLEYSDHTKAALQKIVNEFEANILKTAKAEIAAATTHAEAYAAWKKWTDDLGRSLFDELTFNGDKFQSDFSIIASRYDTRGYRGGTTRIRNWGVENMHTTLIVTDFPLVLTSKHKAMAKDYIALKGMGRTNYVLFSADPASAVVCPWITRERFVKWEDLRAALPKPPAKPRQTATAPGRIPGTWDYWTKDGFVVEEEIPADTLLFWVPVKNTEDSRVRNLIRLLNLDGIVIKMPANRLNKFMRENKATNLFEYAKSKVVLDGPSLLSDRAKVAMRYTHEAARWAQNLDATKCADPMIAQIKQDVADFKSLTARYEDNKSLAQHSGMWYDLKHYNYEKSFNPIIETYPLLADLNYWRIPGDVYIYMNAKYESENKNV